MRRLMPLVCALLIAVPALAGCFVAPQAKQPAIVTVAAVTYGGGGAPTSVLSLYKAALEVNKAAAGDFELRLTQVSPNPVDMQMQKLQSGPSSVPPSVAALEQAMGQDPPPDVVFFSSSYEFGIAAEKGLLQDLDPLLRADRSLKREDFFPGALEALSDGGRLYGLPISVAPTVLQYDRRLFDAAGLPYPDASLDWAGFVNLARALTKSTGNPQTDQWGISLMSSFPLPFLIWQNGGEIVSKDGRRSLIADTAAVEAIKFYVELMSDPSISPPYPSGARAVESKMAIAQAVRPGEAPPLFAPGGRVAMQFMSGMSIAMGYGIGPYGGTDSPLRITEPPHGKNKATMLELQSVMALTSKARNNQAAFRALAALSDEMQKELPIPAKRSAAKNIHQTVPYLDEKDAEVLVNALEYARAIPLSVQQRVMRPLYEKIMQPLQQGTTKTPVELATEAAEAIDLALNDPNYDPNAPPTSAAPGK